MNFHSFHIPTNIIQGYETFTYLNGLPEIVKKRVVIVTDPRLIAHGLIHNICRSIENQAYGVIFYEAPPVGQGISYESICMVQDSRAQTVVGFGDTRILSTARAMIQMTLAGEPSRQINYIEIPSIPCLYTGIQNIFYTNTQNDPLKRPYYHPQSRANFLFLDSAYAEFGDFEEVIVSSVQVLAYSIDALLSRHASMLSEFFALGAIEILFRILKQISDDPLNLELRKELMYGALLGSFAIQSANLGITAGLSMGIESVSSISDTRASAAILSSVLEYNTGSHTVQFQKIAKAIGIINITDPIEISHEIINAFQELLKNLNISSLVLPSEELIETIAKNSARYEFMKDLHIPTGYIELMNILNQIVKDQ